MRLYHLAAAGLLAAIPAAVLVAQPKDRGPQGRPQAFEALVACRALTDDSARLKCFDAAAAELQSQADRRDLVLVDRQQMRDTKRRLFGLDIPDLNPFGGSEREEDEVKSLDGVVSSAYLDGNSRWVIRLEDGSHWAQTDDNPIVLRPRAGHKVRITRAAMGSYMMRVNGQPGVRAKRLV